MHLNNLKEEILKGAESITDPSTVDYDYPEQRDYVPVSHIEECFENFGEKNNVDLYEALQVCSKALATYGKHPIIEEQVTKALLKAKGENQL